MIIEFKLNNDADVYEFDGPFAQYSEDVTNGAGVYCILGRKKPTSEKDSRKWNLIYVGQSGKVKDRIKDHEWESRWFEKAREEGYDEVKVAVYSQTDFDETKREALETGIRNEYNPLCGKQ